MSYVKKSSWSNCPASTLYLPPAREGRFFETSLQIANLSPYQSYKITVIAENDASVSMRNRDVTSSAAEINFQTKEAGKYCRF